MSIKMFELIKYPDILGIEPRLYVKRQETHQTVLGGILSTLIFTSSM